MQNAFLKKKIKRIKQLFDINKILSRETQKNSEIAGYYRTNRLAYYFFNSKNQFVHMGLSKNGIFKKEFSIIECL